MPKSALVLFSGGQDSAACLAWALERYEQVETVGFDYGQIHKDELKQAITLRRSIAALKPKWAERLGSDHRLALPALGEISDTSLTRETEILFDVNGLPNSFVPGRNLIFLCFAAALAYRRGVDCIVGGMCETDYSGYPDCRDDAIKAMQVALNIGMDRRFVLETPLMWLDKAQTWRLAEVTGGPELVALINEQSWTCYRSERGPRHDWGHGCGTCPACNLRRLGWEKYRGA